MKILARITEPLDEIVCMNLEELEKEVSDMDGFFLFLIGDWEYGYFHSGPLRPDESGGWNLIQWFEEFFDAIRVLKTGSFVAIRDIETTGTWIAFERTKNGMLKVMEIVCEGNIVCLDQKPKHYEIRSQANMEVSLHELEGEVNTRAVLLVEQLACINPNFSNHYAVKALRNLIS